MVGDELFSLMKNGVAGVAAPVVAQYVGISAFFAQKMGNLALTAVSVLEIYDDVCSESRHVPQSSSRNVLRQVLEKSLQYEEYGLN